jgi:hypothetical protein
MRIFAPYKYRCKNGNMCSMVDTSMHTQSVKRGHLWLFGGYSTTTVHLYMGSKHQYKLLLKVSIATTISFDVVF